MPTELIVPIAVDSISGRLVEPEGADRASDYRCPGCAAPVRLRAGTNKVRLHFAHVVDGKCDGESLIHVAAKLLLIQVINDHAQGQGPGISLACKCKSCNTKFFRSLPRSAFSRAADEQRSGAFRVDVMAYKGEQAALGIEVLHTHAVDERKAAELLEYWIELKADSVLLNPTIWAPVQSRLKPLQCPACRHEGQRIRQLAERIGFQLEAGAMERDPTRARYIPALAECWSCKRETLWFWWSGVPFAQTPPPVPAPQTVQERYSKQFGGKYWANNCLHCGQVQGDNFVFLGLGRSSPFRGLPMRESASVRAAQRSKDRVFIDTLLPSGARKRPSRRRRDDRDY